MVSGKMGKTWHIGDGPSHSEIAAGPVLMGYRRGHKGILLRIRPVGESLFIARVASGGGSAAQWHPPFHIVIC